MATVTIAFWISALVLAVIAALMISSKFDLDDDQQNTLIIVVGVLLIFSLALAEAINFDLYGETSNVFSGPIGFYCLWGAIALLFGSSTVVGLQIYDGKWDPFRTRSSFQSAATKAVSIGSVIGFISSILTIVSFYLDHILNKHP